MPDAFGWPQARRQQGAFHENQANAVSQRGRDGARPRSDGTDDTSRPAERSGHYWWRRHRGRRDELQRAGGRRLGNRRDRGSADQVAKMVVTDDQGRYVIPDLPSANYTLWVRGYGLVDGPKATSRPGQHVNLTATPAPTEA